MWLLDTLKRKTNWLSLFIVIFCSIYLFINQLTSSKWKEGNIIQWDVKCYYIYLPSTLIYKDISFNYKDKAPAIVQDATWYETNAHGQRFSKTSIGMALMYLPFFTVAHAITSIVNPTEANGYSTLYQYSIVFSAFVYFTLGLFFLRKLLLFFFKDSTVSFAILLIGLGTNLYYYACYESGMSHVASFFLITLFLYLTHLVHNQAGRSAFWWLFLVLGFITLIRPLNFLVAIIPLLYQLNTTHFIKNRITFLVNHKKEILQGIFIFSAVIMIQLVYWKIQTGSWVVDTYSSNERFFWSDPKIIQGLFSFRKGLFVYTPVLFFASIGWILAYKRYQGVLLAYMIYMSVITYFMFSWWCWWYGGGYGIRAMIDHYAIWAFPLSIVVEHLLKERITQLIAITCSVFFVYLSLFQTRQYKVAHIHWDSMTEEAYWAIFMKKQPPENYSNMLKTPDYEAAKKGIR